MKILIIEDEVELQETIKKSLLKEKYTVETASDFNSANCFDPYKTRVIF
ncbi:response regulator transcription factor [Formosa sp. L2A11]|nr:response regulator transcription factor [Formosa sp. L2A11]